MAILRVHKTSNYTIMSNYHFKEKEMSLKAKGLLSLMLSLPNDWDYSIEGLVSICKENETSIISTLKELKQFGYLVIRKLLPNETTSGRIEYEYDIYETPNQQKQDSKKQDLENLGVENLGLENQGQVITNNKIINKLNTNNIYNIIEEKEITKEKENVEIVDKREMLFNEFWKAYPRKVNKNGAKKSFMRIPKLEQDFELIMNKLEDFKKSKSWQDNNGQYIPHPQTWINQKRWEDEMENPSNIFDNIDMSGWY